MSFTLRHFCPDQRLASTLLVCLFAHMNLCAAQDELIGTVHLQGDKHDRFHAVVTAQLTSDRADLAEQAVILKGGGVDLPGRLWQKQTGHEKPVHFVSFVLPSLAAEQELDLKVYSDRSPANFAWKTEEGKSIQLSQSSKAVFKLMLEPYDNSSEERREQTYKVFHHVFSPVDGKTLLTKGPGGLFTHHRGLFYGFSKTTVNGQVSDTWHCKGKVRQEFDRLDFVSNFNYRAGHGFYVNWFDREGNSFLTERRRLYSYRLPHALLLEFRSTLSTDQDKVKLDGDPQHAGFQFRATQQVAAETKDQTFYIRPDGKGSPGQFRNWVKQGEPVHTNHKNLPWNAMSFVVDGKRYTCCYLDHPDNPKPARYSERDYGRFGSYFVSQVTKDQPLSVKYRIWIQEGEMTVEQIERLSRDFVDPLGGIADNGE